jgi:hypothetical protein
MNDEPSPDDETIRSESTASRSASFASPWSTATDLSPASTDDTGRLGDIKFRKAQQRQGRAINGTLNLHVSHTAANSA